MLAVRWQLRVSLNLLKCKENSLMIKRLKIGIRADDAGNLALGMKSRGNKYE